MSLDMSKLQARSKAKWRGHHTIAECPVAVSWVTGVTLPIPGLSLRVSLGLGLSLPLVVTMAMWEVAVGMGGVTSKERR